MGEGIDERVLATMEAATIDDKRRALAAQEQGLAVRIEQLQTHLRVVGAANKILAARVFAFVALLGDIGLFIGCAFLPEWPRIAATVAYSVVVFLPVLWWAREPKKE